MTRLTVGAILLLGGIALMCVASLFGCGWLELLGLGEYAESLEEEFPMTEGDTTAFGASLVLAPCIAGLVGIGGGAGVAYWGARSRAKQGQPIRDRDWAAAVLIAGGTVGLCACSPFTLLTALGAVATPVPPEETAASAGMVLMCLMPPLIAAGALVGGMVMMLLGSRRSARTR